MLSAAKLNEYLRHTTMQQIPTDMDAKFPRHTQHDPLVPVWCLTPNQGGCIHRFFDTTPISPSGRYVALFRLPREDRFPGPGDEGQIVLIDLAEGTEKSVATTRGWEPQMGANINWGPDDHTLLFNDVDTSDWSCHLVKLDPLSGRHERLPGGIYHASPCGRYVAAANLPAMRRTQTGYGVIIPDDLVPRQRGARDDQGLFITDITTGDRRLVLPLSEAVKHIRDLDGANLDDWEIYGFHCKWSPDGNRLIFTVRRFPARVGGGFDVPHQGDDGMRFDVLTCKPDGSDVHNAVPAEYWRYGGHHINWFPDSGHLSMNLNYEQTGMRLWRVRYDGTDLHKLFDEPIGSGHPSVHPDGRHILTDTYVWEQPFVREQTVPLRWIDRAQRSEIEAIRICSRVEPTPHGALRVDPHPSWDRTWRYVTFNGVADNTRRVYLADFGPLLDQS